MKRFSFPLEGALAWRRFERDREQAALLKLVSEHAALERRLQAMEDQRLSTEHALANGTSLAAEQVGTLSSWQARVRARCQELASERSRSEAKIAAQRVRFIDAERNLRVLERLRDDRLKQWRAEVAREEELVAAEAFLARSARLRKSPPEGA